MNTFSLENIVEGTYVNPYRLSSVSGNKLLPFEKWQRVTPKEITLDLTKDGAGNFTFDVIPDLWLTITIRNYKIVHRHEQ